jgi:hypothetical protein
MSGTIISIPELTIDPPSTHKEDADREVPLNTSQAECYEITDRLS